MQRNTPPHTVAILSLVALTLGAGCGTTGDNQRATDPVREAECALPLELQAAVTRLDEQLARAMESAEGDEGLARVKADLERLRSARDLTSLQVCDEIEQGRITLEASHAIDVCLGQRLGALGAMAQAFDEASLAKWDARQLAWRLSAKVDWLEQTLTCESAARTGKGRGAGFEQDRAFELGQGSLEVTSTLLCERRAAEGEGFDPVERCNGATLRDGDRFKVTVKTSAPAYLYFYLYNGSGQFQMFFPDKDVANQGDAATRYVLPPASWMVLDDVSGVFERVLVVASTRPLEALERLRGANLPPTSAGDFDPEARRARGIIEPLITRGGKIEGARPIQIEEAGGRQAFPVIVQDAATVAIEYEIYHAPR